MLTQWNVSGGGGVVGLRYEVLPVVYAACGIARKDQPEVFDGLQTMERRALELLNKK